MSKKKRSIEDNSIANEKREDKSPKVPQRAKINFDLNIYERSDLTEKQLNLKNIILDKKTNIVFINGCAGTSKTFMAVYCPPGNKFDPLFNRVPF